jgi:hypothetical protein
MAGYDVRKAIVGFILSNVNGRECLGRRSSTLILNQLTIFDRMTCLIPAIDAHHRLVKQTELLLPENKGRKCQLVMNVLPFETGLPCRTGKELKRNLWKK